MIQYFDTSIGSWQCVIGKKAGVVMLGIAGYWKPEFIDAYLNDLKVRAGVRSAQRVERQLLQKRTPY